MEDLTHDDDENDDESSKNSKFKKEGEEDTENLAEEEARELEEARKERTELMAAEQKVLAEKMTSAPSAQEKMQYLLSQSDVFAHIFAGELLNNISKNI